MSHIKDTEKQQLLRELAEGYKKMADINLEAAEAGLVSDNESLSVCERELAKTDGE